MASKMLIDAAHPEETRVVAVRGNRVEEFDYESASKKQLRGNIYLAKVTRVEPSLQAAFVDYGGNRHGFLAFTEIHPDYYQIPVADRQALLEEEAAEQSRASAQEAAEDDEAASGRRRRRGRRGRGRHEGQGREGQGREGQGREGEARREAERPSAAPVETIGIAKFEIGPDDEIDTTPRDDSSNVAMEASDLVHEVSEPVEPAGDREDEAAEITVRTAPEDDDDDDDGEPAEVVGQPVATKEGNGDIVAESVESVGSEDALEEVPERARRRRGRPYKIQEVIRRRQIILVQVVKEERGNKGAALTTYLSLAGRYTRADAEHRARRRHLAQDHPADRPQAPARDRRRARSAGRHGPHHPHRRRPAHQDRDQARLRLSAAAVGERARPHAEIDRAGPGL